VTVASQSLVTVETRWAYAAFAPKVMRIAAMMSFAFIAIHLFVAPTVYIELRSAVFRSPSSSLLAAARQSGYA
jgi:hypothetical protein